MLKFTRPARLPGLSPKERLAYLVGAAINETPVKHAATWFNSNVTEVWLRHLAMPLVVDDGMEHLPVGRSFILAANHRTFFDFYATSVRMWQAFPRWKEPHLYCPVRSEWFYTTFKGPFFNTLISAHAMYPPIFRDKRGSALNQSAIDACQRVLDWSDRTVLAIHPEGQRNKTDDPYSFLPAKRGVGRIALATRAPVIPLFINGLAPSFGDQVKRRFRSEPQEPIRLFFGAPVPLDDLYDRADDRDAWLEAAQRTMGHIGACAEREKAWVAAQPA